MQIMELLKGIVKYYHLIYMLRITTFLGDLGYFVLLYRTVQTKSEYKHIPCSQNSYIIYIQDFGISFLFHFV